MSQQDSNGSWAADESSISVEDGKVGYADNNPTTVETDTDNKILKGDEGADQGASGEPSGAEEGDEGGTDAGGDDGKVEAEPITLEDLPDYDAANEETVAAYKAQFTTEDGQLNLDRIGLEADRNLQRDGKAELNPGTYAYLEALAPGIITRSLIDGQLAMRENAAAHGETLRKAEDAKLFDVAGGPERLSAAKEWAKAGGMTEAQIARHEAALKSTNYEDRAEAVELLMTRYDKANPKVEPRRDTPIRDATNGQGKPSTPSVQPFASKEEWRKARKESGGNMALLREIDKRARASGF